MNFLKGLFRKVPLNFEQLFIVVLFCVEKPLNFINS